METSAPEYPTHALKIIDNSCGDKDKLFIFAYQKDGIFYNYDNNRPVIEYFGDEILCEFSLCNNEIIENLLEINGLVNWRTDN